MMNKAVIYARLSREDEDKIDGSKESKSIENQIKILSDYAKDKSFKIVKVYYDDGYSGATMERPQFQLLLKDMRKKKFNILLMKDLSRLGRSMHRVGEYIEQIFPANGIRVIALSDNYDSSFYGGEESIVLRAFLNEYYLKDFRMKCKKARTHYAKTTHISYYPKYGYNFDENGKEYIDEYSSNIVKKIFNLIVHENKTLPQIAKILNAEGVMTRSEYQTKILGRKKLHKQAAKSWRPAMVYEIAKDIEYCGHALNWARHKKEEQILLKNMHLAIIDEEMYYEAQKKLLGRSRLKIKLDHLGPMIIDRNSGKHLYYARGTTEFNGSYFLKLNGRQVYSFHAHIFEDIVFHDVMNIVKCCQFSEDRFYQMMKKKLFEGEEFRSAQLNASLEKYNKEYSQILESYFNGRISEMEFNEKSKEMLFRIKNVETRSANLKENEVKLKLFEIRFKKFINDIQILPKERKEVIRMVCSKIYVNSVENRNNFDITIVYRFNDF